MTTARLGAFAFILASSLMFSPQCLGADSNKFEVSCSGSTQSGCMLIFKGEIVTGGAKALESAIRSAPAVVEVMAVTSPGGDVFEALKMSAVLNKYFVEMFVGERNGNGDLLQDWAGGDCASACALMFVTANQRFGTEVFLHRPTFQAEVFREMSGEKAERAYNVAAARLRADLRAKGPPDALIEEIFDVPSDTVRKLDTGFPERSPWLEEWLAAKCGGENAAGVNAVSAPGDMTNNLLSALGTVAECEQKAIRAAQMRAQHRQ